MNNEVAVPVFTIMIISCIAATIAVAERTRMNMISMAHVYPDVASNNESERDLQTIQEHEI